MFLLTVKLLSPAGKKQTLNYTCAFNFNLKKKYSIKIQLSTRSIKVK